MRDLVNAHIERGHTVVLSSSALTIQVDPVAQFSVSRNTLSNMFETDEDGVLTGKVVKPVIWGRARPALCRSSPRNAVSTSGGQLLYADGDGHRVDGTGRQPAAHQSRRQDGRGRAQARLADPEFTSWGRGPAGQVRNLVAASTVVPAATARWAGAC